MIINIVAGSPACDINLINFCPCDILIGVDYGAYKLIHSRIHVDYAVGDFDSIDEEELQLIKDYCRNVYVYESEKSETDTEIALKLALSLKPDIINLFGVTGKRLDHFLGTLNLYQLTLNENVQLNIIDANNKIYLLKPGNHVIKKSGYKYISFFSYKDMVKSLTLSDFKYELNNYDLYNTGSLTISNEIKKESGRIEFAEGYLLIVESRD